MQSAAHLHDWNNQEFAVFLGKCHLAFPVLLMQIVLMKSGKISTLLVLVGLLSLGTVVRAQVLPPERIANWTPGIYTGVSGGIPTNRPIFTNMILLDKTGKTDISAALQAAINACPANQAVVIPAGTFLVSNIIYLKPSTTVRGAGMANTVLNFSAGQFRLDTDNSFYRIYTGQIIAGGLGKGSTNITLTNTTEFTVGQMCLIAQFSSTNQYDNPLIVGVGGTNNQYGYIYRVLARVTAKTPSGISIWPPLPGDMSARHARILPTFLTKSGIGIEGLKIELSNSTSQVGIMLGGVVNSWIKGVRIHYARNYSIHVYDSLNVEVRDCYLDDLNHGGSNGAGLLMNTVCSSLIENNIIMNSFPCLEINAGSSGNVIGYNFMLNTNNLFEIDSNHGPHNAYNLYEGNVAGRFLSDGYFGSESEGTVFRNWFHGTLSGQNELGFCFALKRFTRNYNVVGNIFGRGAPYVMSFDGTAFGQPNMGNSGSSGFAPQWADWGKSPGPGGFQEMDTNVVGTLIRKGNYNYFNKGIPASEALEDGQTLPNSMYRGVKPAWFGTLTWPPFNAANPTPAYTNIPAGYFYVNGTHPEGSELQPPAPPAGIRLRPLQ